IPARLNASRSLRQRRCAAKRPSPGGWAVPGPPVRLSVCCYSPLMQASIQPAIFLSSSSLSSTSPFSSAFAINASVERDLPVAGFGLRFIKVSTGLTFWLRPASSAAARALLEIDLGAPAEGAARDALQLVF